MTQLTVKNRIGIAGYFLPTEVLYLTCIKPLNYYGKYKSSITLLEFSFSFPRIFCKKLPVGTFSHYLIYHSSYYGAFPIYAMSVLPTPVLEPGSPFRVDFISGTHLRNQHEFFFSTYHYKPAAY